jgi:type IV pilus assembly protein PilB
MDPSPSSLKPDDPVPPRRKYLGELLLHRGVITREQLNEVLELKQKEKGTRVGRLLLDLGYATESQICEVMAEQLQLPAIDLVTVDIPDQVVSLVPKELATRYSCLPWFVEGQDLYLIMADPTDVGAADAIAFHSGLRIKSIVAPESEISLALERYYNAEATSVAHAEDVDLARQLEALEDEDKDAQKKTVVGSALVRLVNGIVTDAIRAGASDIEIEPLDDGLHVRYRVDGLLRDVLTMPTRIQKRVVSRIKSVAHMDVSERHDSQDGRTLFVVAGQPYALRVRTLPAGDGERVDMRILAQARAKITVEDLGLESDVLGTFKEMLRRTQGMVLVTGPKGSGKTSTLYAALNFWRGETTRIVTIEDPVEYRLPGVNQLAVSEKAGLSFAAGLRSALKQNPDVVMVGEILDKETAQVAFQAAQAGHLVLSKLHAADAPSAIASLVDLGVPPYLLGSSLIAVLTQRLVRRLCDCRSVGPLGSAEAKGCRECRDSGFKGRIALFELLRVTPRVRSVLLARASGDIVRRAARASGMRTMLEDGTLKAGRGMTVMAEVLSAAPADESDVQEPEAGEALPIPAALSHEVRRARRARILVVDDELAMLEMLRDLLTSEGYEVITASDGREAWSAVRQEVPDLILSDIRMPGMDGLEFLKRIRGDASTNHVPMLFLTGLGSVDEQTRAYNLGTDDYIEKPVQSKLLASRVRRALFRAHILQPG